MLNFGATNLGSRGGRAPGAPPGSAPEVTYKSWRKLICWRSSVDCETAGRSASRSGLVDYRPTLVHRSIPSVNTALLNRLAAQ